ncbi:MAG: ABC transporter permease, partial [Acidobacteria bacterium]|nr:ABC transporter permease [Acidobacteriota bacterium]
MTTLLREMVFSLRALAKRPGYAVVSTLTLALGFGAVVAIFTVVNAVLLRPLPFPDSQRVVSIRHHAPAINLPELQSSSGLFTHYREGAPTLAVIAAYDSRERNITGDGARPERVRGAAVTPEIFDVLATRPAIGRPFHEADARDNAAPVVILTDTLWRSRFGAREDIIGRRVELDGMPAEVVGVMPAGFAYPDPETRLLLPLWLDPARPFGTFGTRLIARLAPGVSVEAARAQVQQLQGRIPERFPDMTADMLKSFGWGVTVEPLRDSVVRDVSAALWILFAAIGLVLLVAAANVANLFLVRAESRQREIAVRAALGAGRGRIAAAFIGESTVLAVIGGVAGLALAAAGTQLLVAYGPARLPRLHEVSIDATVIAFALAITAATAVALGALPVSNLARRSFVALLRDGGRGATVGRHRHRVRQLLVAGQVTLALVLLIGSALMVQSLMRLRAVDPGFRVDGILTAGISPGGGDDRLRRAAFYQRVLDEVATLPGVVSVGGATSLPIAASSMNGSSFDIQGRPRAENQVPPVAMYHPVMSGYFETLGIPLRAGRLPERADSERVRPIVWVNEAFVRSFMDGRALGERIRIGGDDQDWLEIVGIVGDVRTFGLREDVRPMAYVPPTTTLRSVNLDVLQVVMATSGQPLSLAPMLRPAIDRVDPAVPLTSTRTMSDVVSGSLAQQSFAMTLVAIAAIVTLILGAIGLYGVISFIVSQRTVEIGVRMALGAQPGDVQALVLRQGLSVVFAGLVAGLIAAAGTTSLLRSQLFGVSARDPLTFAAVAAVLVAVSLVAIYLPARRA